MEVFLFAPEGAGPHPGLVLCQHIPAGHTGLENDPVTLKTAERYCENGYFVAVPFIFHGWPKSADIEVKRKEFRDDWTRLDLDAAFGLLAAQPGVDRERIGIAGHCWGGRVAGWAPVPTRATRPPPSSTAGASSSSWAKAPRPPSTSPPPSAAR